MSKNNGVVAALWTSYSRIAATLRGRERCRSCYIFEQFGTCSIFNEHLLSSERVICEGGDTSFIHVVCMCACIDSQDKTRLGAETESNRIQVSAHFLPFFLHRMNHFKFSVGAPLHGTEAFPTRQSQIERFKKEVS